MPASQGPVDIAGVGNIDADVLYITEEDVVLQELPAIAPYTKIVVKKDANVEFKCEVPDTITVENEGIISGGSFSGDVTNKDGGIISGGAFVKDILTGGAAIQPGTVNFSTHFILGSAIYARTAAADMEFECSAGETELVFTELKGYEFGVSANAEADAPDFTGLTIAGLTAETAYTVFARSAIQEDWTRLSKTVSTLAASGGSVPTAPENYITISANTSVPVVGETVQIAVDTNLPAEEPILYQWTFTAVSAEMPAKEPIAASSQNSYTISEGDVGYALTVQAYSANYNLYSAPLELAAVSSTVSGGGAVSAPYMLIMDYEAETIFVEMADGLAYDLRLSAAGGAIYAPKSKTITAKLSDLLGGAASTDGEIEFSYTNESGESTAVTFSLPTRPEFDGANVIATVGEVAETTVQLSCSDAEYQPGLISRNGERFWADANGLVSGLAPDSRAEYTVMLRRRGSNAEQRFASNAGPARDTEGKPITVRVKDAFHVKILVNLMDENGMPAQYAAGAPVSDTQNALYTWYAVDLAGNETKLAETANENYFINLTEDMQKALFFRRMKVVVTDGVTGATASDMSDVFHTAGLAAAIDYAGETVTLTAPAAPAVDCTLYLGASSLAAWPAGETRFSVKLSDISLPGEAGDSEIEFHLIYTGGLKSSVKIAVPARTAYSGGDAAVKECLAESITLEAMEGVEFGLSVAGAAAPDESLGRGPEFTDLMAGVEYQVWMRSAATESAFASSWKAAQGTVTTTMPVVAGKPDAKIDFVNEKLVVAAPEAYATESLTEWNAALNLGGGVLLGGFADGERSRSLTLGLMDLPSNTKAEAGYVYLRKTAGDVETRSECIGITIPARPAFSGDVTQITVERTSVGGNSMSFSCTEGYEVVLVNQNKSIRSNGSNSFNGLTPGTEYEVYVCNRATETAFASVPAATGAIAATLPFSLAVDKTSLVPGETITATLTTGGASYPDLIYTWYTLGESGLELLKSGTALTKYTAVAADVGKSLLVEAYSAANSLYTYIEAAKVNAAPVITPTPTPTMPIASDVPKVTPTIEPVITPTPTPTAAPTINTDWGSYYFDGEPEADGQGYDESERLYDDYLVSDYGWDSIVFDDADQPMDYELLPVYFEGGDGENSMLVVAQPDMEGEIVNRTLRLYMSQLQHMYDEKELSTLIFRNGDADVYLRMEELLTGDVVKLIRMMLESSTPQIDPLDLDFESMEEVFLTLQELSDVYLEVRINPVVVDEETWAWDVSVWLHTDGGVECEISNLLYDFYVCLNVNGMFALGSEDEFANTHTVALLDMESGDGEEILLDSEMLILPDEMPEGLEDISEYFSVLMPYEGSGVETYYEAAMPVDFYRNYAMATFYAGPGAYLVTELE